MAKFISVEDSGYIWHIPLEVVAKNRAAFYADDPDTTESDEISFVMEDDYEGIDWFRNNMNWEDVANSAYIVQTPIAKTEPDMGDCITDIVEIP